MGEETEVAEPISSDDVEAAGNQTANEPSRDTPRKRKKQLYKSIQELMEFYLGDVNINKNRFMFTHMQGKPFVYMDLSIFLTFNKVKALTSNIEDIAESIKNSEILELSEDRTQVCRKTKIEKKENEDDCTIYVEQLGPEVDHDILVKVFSDYGPVDYVSMPRYSHNNKFKGFAFVEFRDPDAAKKAMEALNLGGCCLSPHMAPEELLSIKSHEPNKENKANSNITQNKKIKFDDEMETNEENFDDVFKDETKSAKVSQHLDEEAHKSKRGRRKRSSSESENQSYKRVKVKCEPESEKEDCEEDKLESTNQGTTSTQKTQKEKRSNVSKSENLEDSKEKLPKSQEGESSGSALKEDNIKEKKGQKRKHSTDEDEAQDVKVKTEPAEKKIKEEEPDSEGSDAEVGDEQDKKEKRKRKKKKKVKKDKVTAASLGLKVLTKQEWKHLRNKYLGMQRDTMRHLKQQLSYGKWEKNKMAASGEAEDRHSRQREDGGKSSKKHEIRAIPGTVVKISLDDPITDVKSSKIDMRIHPEIRYVDVAEGSSTVYLRTSTPDTATFLVQSQRWPNMEVITGEEEAKYWDKMKKDRDEHFNKAKPTCRGRTKLLKKAERIHGANAFEALQP